MRTWRFPKLYLLWVNDAPGTGVLQATGDSADRNLSRASMQLWLRTSSQRVVPANQAVSKVGNFSTDGRSAVCGATKLSLGAGGLKRLQQGGHSENVDDPFEIVAQHANGQLGFRFFQPADQEAGMGHQPFHRPKRVFGRFPALLHPYRIGRRPQVHRLPRILVKIAYDDATRRLGTLRLQRAGAARP